MDYIYGSFSFVSVEEEMYRGVRGQIVLFDHVRSNSREVLPIGCQVWDDLDLCGVLSTGIRKSVLKSVQRHPVEFL